MADELDHSEIIRHLRGIRHVVINRCHGGFGISPAAQLLYLQRSMTEYTVEDRESRDETERYGQLIRVDGVPWDGRYIARDDTVLVSVIRELGTKSYGQFAKLKIVEVPADVNWVIDDYDGQEWVAEVHRRWY